MSDVRSSDGSSAMQRAVLVVAVVLVIAGAAAAIAGGRTSELDLARDLVADEDQFARATTAGQALASASVHLQNHGEGCRESCDRFFTAAAMARTSAVVALRCKRPDLFELRREFADYLDALANGDAAEPPFPPAC